MSVKLNVYGAGGIRTPDLLVANEELNFPIKTAFSRSNSPLKPAPKTTNEVLNFATNTSPPVYRFHNNPSAFAANE